MPPDKGCWNDPNAREVTMAPDAPISVSNQILNSNDSARLVSQCPFPFDQFGAETTRKIMHAHQLDDELAMLMMALRAGNSLSSLANLFCFIGHLAEIIEWQSVANRRKLAGSRYSYPYVHHAGMLHTSTRTSTRTVPVFARVPY